MKTFKAIVILLLSLILKLVFFIPTLAVWIIKVVEGALRITRNTITHLMEQIQDEVLNDKIPHDGEKYE